AADDRGAHRLDDVVDRTLGHTHHAVLLADADRADLAARQAALVRDRAHEVAGSHAGAPAEADVEVPRGAAALAGSAVVVTPGPARPVAAVAPIGAVAPFAGERCVGDLDLVARRAVGHVGELDRCERDRALV